MKKLTLLVLSLLLVFVICSCTTTQQNILLSPSSVGQMLFIRPTKLSCTDADKNVSEVIVDITVPTTGGEITGNPTVNYSVIVKNTMAINYNNVSLDFSYDEGSVTCANNFLMFKDTYKSDNVLLRYTSTISQEEFEAILANYSNLAVTVTINGTEYSFSSEEFVSKLSEVQFYLK